MSITRLRDLLHQVPSDGQVTLAEVQALIEAARDEGKVTVGELFVLQAALEAHRTQYTPEAYQQLKAFLEAGR